MVFLNKGYTIHMKKLSKMSFTRGGPARDFNKYDKSHDHFFYSSTDDYREDVKDDEVKTSVRTSESYNGVIPQVRT